MKRKFQRKRCDEMVQFMMSIDRQIYRNGRHKICSRQQNGCVTQSGWRILFCANAIINNVRWTLSPFFRRNMFTQHYDALRGNRSIRTTRLTHQYFSCFFVLLMNQYRWGERRGGGRRGEGWGRGEVNSPIAICPRKVEKFFLEQFFHIFFLIIYHLLLYELFIIVCYMQCNLINILYYRNRYCRTTYECN